MARVLITGSSDGLGLMAARLLVDDGHAVTLHARNEQRADDARQALPGAEHVVIGDVARIAGMHQVAEQANTLGRYDAVIHNESPMDVKGQFGVDGDAARHDMKGPLECSRADSY